MPPFLIDTAPWEILTPFVPPKVAVPVIAGEDIVGDVKVLFVNVSDVVRPTNVSVVAGRVIVTLPLKAEWAGACNRA